jgi:4-amino-4-deoxy-L-arabinose transferase-like glycosyltransferase
MDSPWDAFLRLAAAASLLLAGLTALLLRRRDPVARMFLVFFSCCLTFILLNWKLGLDLGQYDARLYHAVASRISQAIHRHLVPPPADLLAPYWAYTLPLALLYTLFGSSPLVGQLLNVLLGVGSLLNLHRLGRLLFSRRVADATVIFGALYPYGWVLAGTLNRDMMIIFFLTLLFRLLAALQLNPDRPGNRAKALLALFSMGYLTLLRPPLLLLCGVVGGVFLFLERRRRVPPRPLSRPLKVGFLLLLFLAGGGLLYLLAPSLATFKLAVQAVQFADIENLNDRLESSEEAASAYMKGVRYSSYADLLWVMPLATFYFMFSPLPWQVASAKQALGLLDSCLLLAVCGYFLRGFRELRRTRRNFALLLGVYLVVGFCSSSLLQANVGAAMRHRTMFYFLMFPVAVQGFLTRGRRQPVPWARGPHTPQIWRRRPSMLPQPLRVSGSLPLLCLVVLTAALWGGSVTCAALPEPSGQFPVVELKAGTQPPTLTVAGAANEFLLLHFRLGPLDPATFQAGVRGLSKLTLPNLTWRFYQVVRAPAQVTSLPAEALLPVEHGLTSPGSAPEFVLVLKIPPGAQRGQYPFEVVLADKTRTYRQVLNLRVFGFALPKDLPLTIFGGFWNYPPEFYAQFGVSGTAQYLELIKTYYRSLREYKINALGGAYPLPVAEVSPQRPVESFPDYHDLVSYALNHAGFRYFMIPKVRNWETAQDPAGPFASQARTFYPLYHQYLVRYGWLGRALNYLIDEPKPEKYGAVYQAYALAREYAPGLKTMCAGWNPAPEFPKVINIWATPAGQYQESQILAQAAKGQKQWLYANRLHAIDHPLVHQRLIGWILHSYPFQGYLLWGVNYWPANPWTTPPGSADYWRRGTFYYPHPRNGLPVPTLRLEALRRGLQDYQYLLLLKEAYQQGKIPANRYSAIQNKVTYLTRDLRSSSFPVTMQELESLRLEIAGLLDPSAATGTPTSPASGSTGIQQLFPRLGR